LIADDALLLLKLIAVLLLASMLQPLRYNIEAADPDTVIQFAELVLKLMPLMETVPAVLKVQFPRMVTLGVVASQLNAQRLTPAFSVGFSA
jgi:hypothetical protein